MAIGSHQSTKMINNEWLTPPEIIEELGPFDTDPCSPVNRPWDTARFHYSIEDNGLLSAWHGRVWLNPPYGKYLIDWMGRMALYNNGIALIFARTETKTFFRYVWPVASGILFIKGRLHFHYVTGEKADTNSGAPSVLIAYGSKNAEILKKCSIKGKYLGLTPNK